MKWIDVKNYSGNHSPFLVVSHSHADTCFEWLQPPVLKQLTVVFFKLIWKQLFVCYLLNEKTAQSINTTTQIWIALLIGWKNSLAVRARTSCARILLRQATFSENLASLVPFDSWILPCAMPSSLAWNLSL